MKITETALKGVFLLEPRLYGDHRGWFMESYSKETLASYGIKCDFVQDNHSYSSQKGTLRGLHFQLEPMAQAKLVRCSRGAVLDVAVDLRRQSPQYKRWVSVQLSAENQKQFFIPRGFAHGFVTLTDNVEVQYKADQYYAPSYDGNIRYNDSEIGIDWGNGPFILSEKDQSAPMLKDRTDLNFVFSVEENELL